MHEGIVHVFEVDAELGARCTQVALRKEKELAVVGQANPDTNIKLTLVDEERPFDVLLYYERVKLYFILTERLLFRRTFSWTLLV